MDCKKFMHGFLNRMRDEEAKEQEKQGTRIKVATSTLEDWLWRGDDPIVRDMSWHVYTMWDVQGGQTCALSGARSNASMG